MNGWFPKIRLDGTIASGNSGIWLTQNGSSRQVSPVGTGAFWAGSSLGYNRGDGVTVIGAAIMPTAYNQYEGAQDGGWAGATNAGVGQLDRYAGALAQSIGSATRPRFGGSRFGYLTPFQTTPPGYVRHLVIDGGIVTTDVILDFVISRDGEFFVYQIATSTYGRQIKKADGVVVSIRDDEAPMVAFVGPDGQPWLLTNTTSDGAYVRPMMSYMGYRITGDLYYPDALMLGAGLLVAGSSSSGDLRLVNIDFSAARVDLRVPAVVEPPKPDPGPIPPQPEPPKPEPPKPTPVPPQPPLTYYNTHKEYMMTDPQLVVCEGPNGRLARVDPSELGKGPFGWYPIHWDGTDENDPHCQFTQTKPDSKFMLESKVASGIFGADATAHAADPAHPFDISSQFYLKPGTDNRGWGEEISIYDGNMNGALMGVVEYVPQAGGFTGFSAAFRVKVVGS